MNKLFETYPESSNQKSINLLKVLAINEGIDYKHLPYKVIFYDKTDVKSH